MHTPDDLSRWVLRSTPDGLWIFDDTGRTTYANDRLGEILGRTPDEMADLSVFDTLDAEGGEQFRLHLQELRTDTAGGDNVECSLLRGDGSRIWALVSHSPLVDDDGERRGWLHRVTELTDRKQLLDQVRSSQQQLAEAQSIAKVGSWEWDIAHDEVTWSDELYRIYHLEPQQFEGSYAGFLSYIHPEDRDRVAAVVGGAFAEGEFFEFDARIVKHGGGEGWVRGRGRVTRDAAGAPVRMSGTAHEITDAVESAQALAAARDAAMETSRLKSEFLTTMSHEIRTPLNGVLGLSELLLRTDLDEQQRRLAGGIDQAGRVLLNLISDILDLSKIEAGRLELEAVDFDVVEVVSDAVALLASMADSKSLRLTVSCSDDVPAVLRGDPVRFTQVVTNLVSNAVKFTPAGEVATGLSLAHRSDGLVTLRVEVTDTGIGVPQEAQAALFDAFTQADGSTTREHGGTGLGLNICRRLVHAMGGRIGMTSEVGAGSTFWFTAVLEETTSDTLPARRGQVSGGSPTRSLSSPPIPTGTARGAVLVVEDNPLNQIVATGMLETLGYEVTVAGDGIEAVERLTGEHSFVAVLMDCQMPRLDGYDATRAVRAHEGRSTHVPIIAMTAGAVAGERERCLAAGMDDFLVKPVSLDGLASVLDQAASGTAYAAGAETARGADQLAPSEPSGVLDEDRMTVLIELQPGEPTMFLRFVDSFLRGTPREHAEILRAVAAGDASGLVEVSHRLKGSALNLGVPRVAATCQRLEDAGDTARLQEAPGLARDLGLELAAATEALRRVRDDLLARWSTEPVCSAKGH